EKKGNSSNPSGESFDDARNDLLDDPTLDEFIMDINTPHNSTSFNNESLEESDKSPIKKSNSN
ncbi:3154_t:CDS:1, partial [Rhizophagus irregularis]